MTDAAECPQPKMLAPFAYFLDHSSALSGMGGSRQPPDPRYCFHTSYHDFLPGIVVFHIRLIRAQATYGEITIRNAEAAKALNLAASWIGTISPTGVLNYEEEEGRGVFQNANVLLFIQGDIHLNLQSIP